MGITSPFTQITEGIRQEGGPQQWRKEPREAQRCLSYTSVTAEAQGLVWRRTASHLLSNHLSTPPRASPGQGSLDQGLVRQIQQLGVTPVSDANQSRHLFIIDFTLGELSTNKFVPCMAMPEALGAFIRISCSGKGKISLTTGKGRELRGRTKEQRIWKE